MIPQQYESKHRNEDGHRQPGTVEQNVEEQNVDNDRAEQRQRERDKASSQTEQAADNLECPHNVNIVADEQRFGEIAGWTARWRWHGKEMKENVQSENDEHTTQ